MTNDFDKETLTLLKECVKMYDVNLKGKTLAFIYQNPYSKGNSYYITETKFTKAFFKHLTGVRIFYKGKEIDKATNYYKFLKSDFNYDDVTLKYGYKAKLKLQSLKDLVNIDTTAERIGKASSSYYATIDVEHIDIDQVVSSEKNYNNIGLCLGLRLIDEENNMCVPASNLKTQLSEATINSTPIIAIFKKDVLSKQYNEICKVKNINTPEQLKSIINSFGVRDIISKESLFSKNKYIQPLIEKLQLNKKEYIKPEIEVFRFNNTNLDLFYEDVKGNN